MVLAPRIEDVQMRGVHYRKKTQAQLNQEMVQGVARLLCADCKLPEDFFLGRYKRILDDTICHIKPPAPIISERVQLVAAVVAAATSAAAATSETGRKRRKMEKHVTFKEEVDIIE